jgi:four helix bundle protein
MKDRKDNLIYQKSFQFAVMIVRLCRKLNEEKREYVLSKQLLRSGTSIGANVREAIEAHSRKDFIAKMVIALKEASESEYWLELLLETETIDRKISGETIEAVREVQRILTAIIKKSRE